MPKIEKTGYYRTRGGDIARVDKIYSSNETVDDSTVVGLLKGCPLPWSSDGSFFLGKPENKSDLVEYLPDCTGFDWKPEPEKQAFTITKPGAYITRNGTKVVVTHSLLTGYPWQGWFNSVSLTWKDNGKHFEGTERPHDIVGPWIESDVPAEISLLNKLTKEIHQQNVDAGWWDQKDNPLIVPTKLALIQSEVSEALEGFRKDLPDDKLPHRKMIDVEIVDVFIRLLDLAGFLGVELGTVLDEKRQYNAAREDHKPENRRKAGGKKF